jgi:crossover junction endodeoxyribonuclease RuvC
MEIKKAVTGSGAASKEQVAALVARTLGSAELAVALDATDALAAALTHVFRARADAIVGRGLARSPGRVPQRGTTSGAECE